ncbi:MAG: N-acetyltransferase [Clostridiales bacterium]|nr:N-acetyltransferase [Clostridiales bacterium]
MITIKEISTCKDLKKFMLFANHLYQDNPYYVPDMLKSQIADFEQHKNPAFAYCQAKCFLAYRKDAIVGRIAAIYNTHACEKYQENQLRFSHADYIDDDEVVDALFLAVETWARELGCASLHGPLGFTDLDREGLLVEGFDYLSQFFVNYNYPYYGSHMERLGFVQDVDWIEHRVILPATYPGQRLEKIDRLAALVQQRLNLRLVSLKKKKAVLPYVKDIFNLYNEAYLKLYGMVALTPAQVDKYVGEFLPLVNQRTTAILLNEQEKVVAFGVVAPSISLAQRKSGGKMFPLGWFHLLRALKGKNDTLDLFLIAVHPKLQGKGVNAIILSTLLKNAIEDGFKYAETGPMLETNADMLSHWRYFDTVQHKRRRAYYKRLF